MRRVGTSLALVILSLSLLPSAAWAWSRDFVLVNHSGYTITRLYLSDISLKRWVRSDVAMIAPQNSERIHFYNNGPCWMQFRIETREGNIANFMKPFNFCALRTLTIYYNNENDRFIADGK